MFYDQARPGSIDKALDLIWALYWQQFVPRSRQDGLRLIWVFVEPAGQMIVLMVVLSLLGGRAAYGDSLPFFLLTGVALLTFFNRASASVARAIVELRYPGRLAQIGLYHAGLARLGFCLTVSVITGVALAWGIGLVERVRVDPVHPDLIVQAVVLVAVLAWGVGLLRGYLRRFLPLIARVIVIVQRAMLFLSGTFYVPAFLPPQLRDVLVWNPVLHGIELLRIGVYGEYPQLLVDPEYLLAWALGTAGLGTALVWIERRRLLE